MYPEKRPMKVDLQGPRPLRGYERELQLPMSPIAQPSSLDLEDMSTSPLSLYPDQTLTSTSKHPRLGGNPEAYPSYRPCQDVAPLSPIHQPPSACPQGPSDYRQTAGIHVRTVRKEPNYKTPNTNCPHEDSSPREGMDDAPLPVVESLFPHLFAKCGMDSHPQWSTQSLSNVYAGAEKNAGSSAIAAESFMTESLLPGVPGKLQEPMNPFWTKDSSRKKQNSTQSGLDTERPIILSGKNKPAYRWEEINWCSKKWKTSEERSWYDREVQCGISTAVQTTVHAQLIYLPSDSIFDER